MCDNASVIETCMDYLRRTVILTFVELNLKETLMMHQVWPGWTISDQGKDVLLRKRWPGFDQCASNELYLKIFHNMLLHNALYQNR